jgi:predicted nuclease with TOPRIM domain
VAETKEQLMEENEALRARISELEAELKQSPKNSTRIVDKEAFDRIQDLPSEMLDETSRLIRALALASAQSARITGETLREFAEDVMGRNAVSSDSRSRDLVMNLPRDILSAGVNAMDRSFKRNDEVVDKFVEAFREGKTHEKTKYV